MSNNRFPRITRQAVCESCNRLAVKAGNGPWQHPEPPLIPHPALPALGTTRTVPEESK